MPKVSVVIPVYNVAPYLRQCLDSVVNQTLREIEIICVDDGSTDGSTEILAEYAAKDARVRVLTLEHTNAGAARNAGMSMATGEYLGFVDSDDWCELTLFEKAYAKARLTDADLVAWRYVQYDNRTQKTLAPRVFPESVLALGDAFAPGDIGETIFSPITFAPWGRMVRRSLVEAENLEFQEIANIDDVYFCCMVTALAQRQSLVDEILYTYRTGRGANLQSRNAETPQLVFEVWQAVADEIGRRGAMQPFRRALVSAASNSLFYTLNVMRTVESYCDFHRRLREFYSSDGFYSTVDESEIANRQTATYFSILKRTATALEFLVQQENYYRERLANEYWTRVSAQKAVREAKSREATWAQEGAKLQERIEDCESRAAECKARNAALITERNLLVAEKAGLESEKASLESAKSCLEKEKSRLEAEKSRLEAENSTANAECSRLCGENEVWKKDAARLKNEKACLQSELARERELRSSLEQSLSFRIGRVLTWVPRKIRQLVASNGITGI